MGTTFVVVCGPSQACEALAGGRSCPPSVEDRSTGRMETAIRHWRGFGTMACPGFRSSSWAGGWLVQLENDVVTGDHRFGFVWDRSQDAVILHWITAQDSSPFLQRAWLPVDLQ